MASIKCLLIFVALCVLVASADEKWNLYTIWVKPNDEFNWERFEANVTVEMNYGSKVKVASTYTAIPLSPPNWWSFNYSVDENVDEIKNITFKYTSVDSPKDKFAMKELEIGQHYYRHRYVYTRSFTLEAPDWLEQNTVYVGYPSKS